MAYDCRSARHRKIETGTRGRSAGGRDDRAILVLGAVADEETLRAGELMIDLHVVGPPILCALERALILRPEAASIHREELILLGAFVREEVVGLVPDHRPADRAAVLI